METRAALFREVGAPLSIERIALDPPGPTEVLVRVAAVGLCRTDYHVMRGERRVAMRPMVLGHEAAGVVEETGTAVVGIRQGDHVVLTFIPGCGLCRWCRQGSASSLRRGPAHNHGAAARRLIPPARPRGRRGRRLLHDRRLCRAHGGRPGLGGGDRPRHPARPREPRRLRRAGRRRRRALPGWGHAWRQRPGRGLRRRRHERGPGRGCSAAPRRSSPPISCRRSSTGRESSARPTASTPRARSSPARCWRSPMASASITPSSASILPPPCCRLSAPPPRAATSW